jgi:hypothetical protein
LFLFTRRPKERTQNQMARIEFTVQIRNPQNGIVTNEARIDLTFPDTAIGDTQDLERAVKTANEKAVQALARNHANATYVLFTRSRLGHHAHVIVTRSASFETPEQRFDQLRLSVGEELDHAEIGERVTDVMVRWACSTGECGLYPEQRQTCCRVPRCARSRRRPNYYFSHSSVCRGLYCRSNL